MCIHFSHTYTPTPTHACTHAHKHTDTQTQPHRNTHTQTHTTHCRNICKLYEILHFCSDACQIILKCSAYTIRILTFLVKNVHIKIVWVKLFSFLKYIWNYFDLNIILTWILVYVELFLNTLLISSIESVERS